MIARSTVKVVAPHLIRTDGADGFTYWWGACSYCGFVREIAAEECENWQRTGTCDICTEVVAGQERAEEASWYRAMSSR